MSETRREYDLENRTLKFSVAILLFVKKVKIDQINTPLINQLIRSATSIGANYCEANGASSKKDFRNKIYICKKEAKETKYWLQLIAKTNAEGIEISRQLWKEAQELTLIFSKIVLSLKNKKSVNCK